MKELDKTSAITMCEPDKLLPYPGNARKHSTRQLNQLVASLREFGFVNPVLVDAHNTIIAGHGRVAAAKKLGLTQVPTLCIDHLSEAQKKAYIIADNRLAELAGWDNDLLRIELREDSFAFLQMLEEMWKALIQEAKGQRIKKVSVTLYALAPAGEVQPDLFDSISKAEEKKRDKSEKISHVMDQLNQKFGKDTVLLGMTPQQGKAFSGTKIAFTRIPDMEEFVE